jgi:hypothetical protein
MGVMPDTRSLLNFRMRIEHRVIGHCSTWIGMRRGSCEDMRAEIVDGENQSGNHYEKRAEQRT